MIIEALYAALALNDSMFYNHDDVASKVFDALSPDAPREYVCILGPKSYDYRARDTLPVLVLARTQDRDDPVVRMSTAGTVVISSLTTGELRLAPLVYLPGKIPLPDDDPDLRRPSPPPGYTPKISYSQRHWWVGLRADRDLPAGSDSIAVAVACGPRFSNLLVTSLAHRREASGDEDYLAVLSRRTAEGEEQEGHTYAREALSPAPPDDIGFRLNPPSGTAKAGRPFILHGSFSLPAAPTSRHTVVPIHVILFARGYTSASHHQLAVAPGMISRQGAVLKGYFSIDLMKEFYYREGDRFDIPREVYVLVIHKQHAAGPVAVATGRRE